MPCYTTKTLGCKVNQFETESIGLALEKTGWHKAARGETADLCIINTCTVTGKASVQSRQAIKAIIRKNPGAKIIVTGCYAQTEASEIRKIEGVHSIISHSDKHLIPEMIAGESDPPVLSDDCNTSCKATEFSSIDIDVSGTRTRPFLKIQDGCNAFCTYCIVPHTRGRSRSMEPEMVMKRLENLHSKGHHEVVLTGIHIGRWGEDLTPAGNFLELLQRIETEKPVKRLRLGSIEPFEISDEIISLVAGSDLICNHFHIPLQSGDSGILKRMNRPYDAEFFRERVLKIHAAVPDAGIGADILTGFPGESETAFQNTCDLIQSLPVSYLHVFPFSPRKGTPAADYENQIPESVKKERTSILRQIGQEKKKDFLNSMLGKKTEVLPEKKRDGKTGFLKGLSSNYITVLTDAPDLLKNRLVKVRITEIHEDSLIGIPVDEIEL